MPRYVVTVPSSKTPEEAFAYMCDMRLFPEWDKGIKKVVLVTGTEPGKGATYDVTVPGFRGKDSVLRYETTEFDPHSNVLLVGKNSIFTSVDRVTVAPSPSGCDVTYDATLTFNGILGPMNLFLGAVFNKVGDRAARGLRKKLA
ncbi:MAG: hypothetical protein RJA47_221 [Actinomycetota bacterium]|jgi:hypothetical protein